MRAVTNEEAQEIFKPRSKVIRSIRVENVTVDVFERQNLYIKDRDFLSLNLTLKDCSAGQTGISFEEQSLDHCIELTLENEDKTGQNAKKFPRKITVMLNPQPLDVYMEKIANYAFAATMCIMISFFVMLGQIKQVAENHALAQSLSLTTIGVNLVWNFFFFAIHFQFCIWGEFMQYLGLPAFWYFISSFTFESRLFILVWRSQLTQQQMFDEAYLRRRLTWFYVMFYLVSFVVVMYQKYFLYNTYVLIFTNMTLWVPQIVKTFLRRSRKGPPTQLVVALLALQAFLPLYLKMCYGNFLNNQTDLMGGFLMILVMAVQVVIIRLQQTWGPRWFVPERFRRNPFAFQYYHDVPQSLITRDKQSRKKKDNDLLVGEEGKEAPADDGLEDMICVICMNSIHLEVDESGSLVETMASQQQNGPRWTCSLANCWDLVRRDNQFRPNQAQVNRARAEMGYPGANIEMGSTDQSGVHVQLNSESSDSPEDESAASTQRTDIESNLDTSTSSIIVEQPQAKYAKKYMRTPCGHNYHTICLKKWIDIRLECPTCRQQIPLPDDD